jgi:hypothetical protein
MGSGKPLAVSMRIGAIESVLPVADSVAGGCCAPATRPELELTVETTPILLT